MGTGNRGRSLAVFGHAEGGCGRSRVDVPDHRLQLWAQAPPLDVRAAACSNAAATREMMDAGLRQLSSFSRLTLTARSAMAKKAAAPKASKAKKAAPAKKK